MFIPSLVSLANGGAIVDVGGTRFFVLDPTLAHQMSLLGGIVVPTAFEAEPQWCNATPPTVPTLGGRYISAPIGPYCHPELAQPYNELWYAAQHHPPYVV